jgi:xanthine/CO dehydrogenase XdhC/CoxF family maturation factor
VLVFGAGDDAKPLVEFMAELDWHVTVADGRAQLIRAERFPQAAGVIGLDAALQQAKRSDAAIIMTHSYEQDRQILRALLPLDLEYLGMLGPRRRTERLVGEIAPGLGLSPDECMSRLHSPVGLDLGGHTPAAVALSITAELQSVFSGRAAGKPSLAHV